MKCALWFGLVTVAFASVIAADRPSPAQRRGDVRVPLSAVRSVRRVDEARREIRGLRAPGTRLPKVIALGTWRRQGSRDFVAVYRREPGFVLEVDGQEFARIIVTGELPAELADLAAEHE